MRRIYLLILITCIGTNCGLSQPFTLDTTFRPNYAFVDAENKNYTGSIVDFYEEPDGRIMLVGGFGDKFNSNRKNWVRLHLDGSVDYSWNPNTSPVDGMHILVRLDNGYYVGDEDGLFETNLVGDILTSYPGIPQDSAFSCGGFGYPYVFEDGSFLAGIGGCAYPYPGNVQRIINFMRVGPDGYLDTSFHHNANATVGWTYPYDSTRILCYGNWVSEYDGKEVNKLFRIYLDGTLDTTFQISPSFVRVGWPRFVQDDGKIIMGANYAIRTGSSLDTFSLYRIHPDGRFDSSFNSQSFVWLSGAWPYGGYGAVCPTSDGGYLIGGNFEKYDGYPRGNIVKTDGNGFINPRYFNGLGIDSVRQPATLTFPAGIGRIERGQNDTYYILGKFLMFDGQPVKPIIRLLGLSHTVGLEEEVDGIQVSVFPNPAHNAITFEWDQAPSKLIISDTEGRVVEEKEFHYQPVSWIWDTGEYTRGMYFYLMKDSDGLVIARGKVLLD